MRTELRIVLGVVLAAGAALVPSAAQAKGASSAQLSGPGIDEPIHFEDGTTPANELAQAAGLFTALHDLSSTAVQPNPPPGDRGAKYVVTYDYMVGQDEDLDYVYEQIRQEIYPFAAGGPLTYTPPGQQLFEEPTGGGWLRAGDRFLSMLVSAGLPSTPPPAPFAPSSSEQAREASALARSGIVAAGVAAGIALLITALVVRRRRSR
jgi:hypothetical protein